MNTLILMAGRGSRFKDIDPITPKPLILLHGQPLVRWVVENIRLMPSQHFIFVCLKEHVEKYRLHDLFNSWGITFTIIISPDVTEGAACSALLAKELINNEEELLIANSDQFVLYQREAFIQRARQYDGLIMSMRATGPKWSYIKVNSHDQVIEVREKNPISSIGTVGIYYFRQGQFFVDAAESMIKADDRHNSEFYLAPCYNYMLNKHSVGHFNVGEATKEMIGLGTAEDFSAFQSSPLSLKISQDLFK
jgi:dTDP-glucose pyrophosphorylase